MKKNPLAKYSSDALVHEHRGYLNAEDAVRSDYWDKKSPLFLPFPHAKGYKATPFEVAHFEWLMKEVVPKVDAVRELDGQVGLMLGRFINPAWWRTLDEELSHWESGTYPNEDRAREIENEWRMTAWADWLGDDVFRLFGIRFSSVWKFRTWFDRVPKKGNHCFDEFEAFAEDSYYLSVVSMRELMPDDWHNPELYVVASHDNSGYVSPSSLELRDYDDNQLVFVSWSARNATASLAKMIKYEFSMAVYNWQIEKANYADVYWAFEIDEF